MILLSFFVIIPFEVPLRSLKNISNLSIMLKMQNTPKPLT